MGACAQCLIYYSLPEDKGRHLCEIGDQNRIVMARFLLRTVQVGRSQKLGSGFLRRSSWAPLFSTKSSAAAGAAGGATEDLTQKAVFAEAARAESLGGDHKISSGKGGYWWMPDPSTGVWAPEGQEFRNPIKDSVDHEQPWFREDVHLGRTDHHERSA